MEKSSLLFILAFKLKLYTQRRLFLLIQRRMIETQDLFTLLLILVELNCKGKLDLFRQGLFYI